MDYIELVNESIEDFNFDLKMIESEKKNNYFKYWEIIEDKDIKTSDRIVNVELFHKNLINIKNNLLMFNFINNSKYDILFKKIDYNLVIKSNNKYYKQYYKEDDTLNNIQMKLDKILLDPKYIFHETDGLYNYDYPFNLYFSDITIDYFRKTKLN